MVANKKWMKSFFPYNKDETRYPNYFDKTIITDKEIQIRKYLNALKELKELENLSKEVWDT